MISELENVDPPEGYQRELLIVYNELFTVAEHKIAVFGQEKVERKAELLEGEPGDVVDVLVEKLQKESKVL